MTSSDSGMSWLQRLETAALRWHSHGVAAMILLVLLAQQGTAQQADDKGGAPNHRVETPVEYRTSFSCVGRVSGYYADVSSGCQMYHMCDLEGRRYTYSCPDETLFQQRMMICDHWYMVNCNTSEQDYAANELIGQRDKPFVSPEEHLHHLEPVYVFATQQNQGPLQLSNWFLIVTNHNQENSAPISSTVPYSGRPMNLSQEAESSNNVSETSHSSTSRKARNKNVITAESEVSIPQISNSTNVTEAMILDSPASSQTRPIAYKINPFFRDLFLRPTPATPQNMTDISMDSDTSRGHNTSAELKDDETRRMAYNIEPFFRDLFFRTTPATPKNMTDISMDSDTSRGQNNTSAELTDDQTRRKEYKIYPFFQDLFLRTTPATPQNMTDISMDADTSRDHNNTSAELKDDETRRMAYKIDPFFQDLFLRTTPATPQNMTDISMDADTSRGHNNTSAGLKYNQTRRMTYKIDPFFQDLFLRTTPATPQNMTDISMDADTSRGHNNTSAGLKDDQTRRMTYKIDPFFQDLFLRTAPSTSRNMTDISIDSDTSRGHNNTSAELKDDQTRPIAYKINPTLQDMFLRTTPETPQNMTDISMDSDTSRGHSNTSPELIDDQNFTVSQPSDESDDLSSLKFSSTRILSQQLSTRETKEVSFLFENPEVNGTPASFIQHKVPETFTNNSVLQYLAKTFTVSASTIAPHNTEQTSTPPVNISVDEIKGDLTNTVHIHVLDPRRMFFIPEMDKNMTEADNYDFQRGNMTLLFVHVPLTSDNGNQSVMHFRAEATVTEGRNPNCVRCHPSFLLPGTCHPCVIIR